MNNKKVIAILLLLVLVGAAAWYFYKRGSGSLASGVKSIGKSDLYAKMLALMDSKIKGGTPFWLLEAVGARLDGTDQTDRYYEIGGRLSDAGALLATYDAGFYGYGYEYKNGKFAKNTGDEYDLHEELHKMLQQAKRDAVTR